MSESNPYEAPAAELKEAAEGPQGRYHLAESPRANSIGAGGDWLGEGFHSFKRNWAAWIGAMLVGMVIMIVVSMIPVVNILFDVFTYFIWVAGIAIGCRAQSEGSSFTVGHLFAGFKRRPIPLMLLSITFYAAMIVAVFATVGLVYPDIITDETPTTLPDDPRLWFAMGIAFLLLTMIGMATVFAPHLIVFHEATMFDAIRLSFSGCLKNILPLLLWTLIMIVIFAVFIAFLVFALGSFFMWAIPPTILFFLVIVPVSFASLYAAYEDIFLYRQH